MTAYAVTLTEVAKNDIADTVAYIAYDLRNLAAVLQNARRGKVCNHHPRVIWQTKLEKNTDLASL